MLTRRTTLILLVAAMATAVGAALVRFPKSPLARAELGAHDLLSQYGRRTPANPKLFFLAVDNESISLDATSDLKGLFGIGNEATPEARALALMSKQWPWPRGVYAHILDKLMGAGAKVVVFDLLFPTPSDVDAPFRAALDRYADRVVIGSNFNSLSGSETDRMSAGLAQPTSTLIPPANPPDARMGYVNFWADPDGIIRKGQFQITFNQFLGAPSNPNETRYSSLAAQAVRKFGRPELVPSDTLDRTIRYTSGFRGFPPRSIYEIFAPEYWKRNFDSGAAFKGAIVVVGAAGNWQHDEHLTPFGIMSGPEIQLNAINALLHHEFIRDVPWPVSLLIWLSAGSIAAFCCNFWSRPLPRLGVFLAVAAAWSAAQFPLFSHFGVFAPAVGPLAVLGLTWLFSVIYDLIAAAAEELRLRGALSERKRAEEILKTANEELERRVAERTAQLTHANEVLSGLLKEKEVLLKEVHHRVKNNLQIISSLLSLQSNYIEDPAALQVFTESRNRVRSMALVHEKLYQSEDLSKVDFKDYIKTLSNGLHSTFAGGSSAVRISLDVESIMLGVDSAIPCGLIVNELVTNCFKYAFKRSGTGEICISMKRFDEAKLQLIVSDNGDGFPKDLDFQNTESLGMQLVTSLTEQISGTIALRNGCGTTFEISFPEINQNKP